MGAVAPPWAAIYSSKLENFCWGGRRLISTRPGSSLRLSRGARPGRLWGRLGVWPAAGLINYYRGSNLVLINRSAVARDLTADLVIKEPIGQVLSQV